MALSRRNKKKLKQAKNVANPSPSKQASHIENPHAYKQQRPAWRFRYIDEDGDWAITDDLLPEIIRVRLKEFEKIRWEEIEAQTTGTKRRHRKHHSQDVSSLCKKAQMRWADLKINYDTVFRFRFGSTIRLWGVRENAVFKPVWWDLKHEVYPTEPD